MHDIAEYRGKQLNRFWSELMLKINSEFCQNQPNYDMWKAGMDTIQQIGGNCDAGEDKD